MAMVHCAFRKIAFLHVMVEFRGKCPSRSRNKKKKKEYVIVSVSVTGVYEENFVVRGNMKGGKYSRRKKCQ